jgi:protein-tyrosine-phosphatase
MSGIKLPLSLGAPVEDWSVPDPVGEGPDVFRAVRDDIENRVMRLVLTLRMEQSAPQQRTPKRI